LLIVAREGQSADMLPDAFIPRLYHQCLDRAALCAMLLRPDEAAQPASRMFNILIVDHTTADAGDWVGMTAQFCSGTVLVVQAGWSDLTSIQGAIGRIGAMGGTVLGTVLADVPAWARAS
jgi:hypothetical protein